MPVVRVVGSFDSGRLWCDDIVKRRLYNCNAESLTKIVKAKKCAVKSHALTSYFMRLAYLRSKHRNRRHFWHIITSHGVNAYFVRSLCARNGMTWNRHYDNSINGCHPSTNTHKYSASLLIYNNTARIDISQLMGGYSAIFFRHLLDWYLCVWLQRERERETWTGVHRVSPTPNRPPRLMP